MAPPTIHVHTQADKSTVPYAKFMWETMVSLANLPELLQLTVHCMGPTAAVRIDGWVANCKSTITPCDKGDPLHGSRGHGACVMEALAMTGDGTIHVIADSDTVIIARGWDDYLRQRLVTDPDRVSILGSTYEDLGGFSSGASLIQTYKQVPSLTWCALSPFHDWRDLNVMPNKAHQVAITTPELASIYNLPIGSSVFGEVGWQLPQYVHDHKLSYDGWKQLKPTKDASVLKGLSDYHEEFHTGGVPFVVHHRGSMRHVYRGDKTSTRFYSTVDAYLVDERLRDPRWHGNEKPDVSVPVFGHRVAAAVTDPIAETPSTFVSGAKEWVKVTFNGKVIRAKRSLDRSVEAKQLEIDRPTHDRIGHLRIEGRLEFDFPLVLPSVTAEPYLVTCRNSTGAPLLVSAVGSGALAVPDSKTWFLLVDVDGVRRVE